MFLSAGLEETRRPKGETTLKKRGIGRGGEGKIWNENPAVFYSSSRRLNRE